MEYDKDIALEVCAGLAEGKSLVTVCKQLNLNYRYIFKWIADYPEFKDNYARAREAQADYLADGVLDVADDRSIPSDDRRVMVDARKWIAGKMKPKKYGDKMQQEHSGSMTVNWPLPKTALDV